MTWTLISASPSPYARKVRIALQEKNLPFTLQTEVPWDTTTKTPQYNPLEKLPVLILDDGKTAIYESHYIMEWLEAKYPATSLMPDDVDGKLFAKQVEVITDGICDALVLAFFENKREEGKQSGPWKERQMRKADGGLQALATFVDQAGGGEFLIGNKLTLADIAIASVLGWLSLRWPDHEWQRKHPQLKKYFDRLDQRESFANTRPAPQNISDPVV
ncbi:glutathione S-transferase [Neohortaea acidophila]|uniref:Glutathione S-transferase n=1 Tax=Neohortaea acidophila TaxID=245834 RepID=A0A6A6Q0J5_9PEZI|nr:glutathione S-transferase [Neohortaea acidophila]KAF2485802.1 glutathione S-transferase [Neohortaea acidophila]